MSLSAEKVVEASNAWSWIPDNATTEATEEYLLVRFPDYFDHPLELLRFSPAEASGASPEAVDTVLDRARRFGLPELHWWVRLDGPPEVADLLVARGATVHETLDVLALDLSRGAPDLRPPASQVMLRWATDISTLRDGTRVGVTVFGGSMPPEDRLGEEAKRDSGTVAAGDGGMVVAYAAASRSAPAASSWPTASPACGAAPSARGPPPGRLPRHPRRPPPLRHRPRRHHGPGQGPHGNLSPDPAPGRLRRLRPRDHVPRPPGLAAGGSPSHPCRLRHRPE